MLGTQQKAVILQKAGMTVPPFPRRRPQPQDGDRDGEAPASQRQLVAGDGDGDGDRGEAGEHAREAAADAWSKAVDKLYADYALARAAHSLREAEHARIRGVSRSGGAAAASRLPCPEPDTGSDGRG
ncbi:MULTISPECIES: hypothetical protein [unclassified Variovorax]|uniref:hypothetical protein n=1 Tax=unclassified Variovorax TaxID=663243 RepID=UPI001BD3A94C|nr:MULTISPECIES: hypothetical protein [unclassified Variovorax]